MTSVVMTGRSIKGWDRFMVRPAGRSARVVRRVLDAAASAGHWTLAVGTRAGLTFGAADADLGAGNDAQLAINDHLLALLQGARDRVMDTVVEQQLDRHLLRRAIAHG